MNTFACLGYLAKFLAPIVFLTTLLETSQAQEIEGPVPPATIQAGVGLLGGFPVGEFGDNVTNPGGGISGHIGYRIPTSPAIIGLDVGYLIYGRESRRERFSLTIPDVTVDVITDNSIILANFFVRFQPREGVMRPYIEGLVGFHYLFTKTSIQNIPTLYRDNIASSTNFDDAAFTYGGGGGVMIRVYDGQEKRRRRAGAVQSVSLDFRVRYLDGSRASYLKKASDVIRQSGQVLLNITRSRTNVVTAFIGAAIEF